MLQDTWSQTIDGEFVEPFAVVSDSNGTIWVLDSARKRIYGFSKMGEPVAEIGSPEALPFFPRGLALFSQESEVDTLAIADTGSGRLLLYDIYGTFLGAVGVFGTSPGQLNEPVDVLHDEFGAYFVTEGANIKRWQHIGPFGKSLAVWPFDAPDALNGSHLAWAPDGSIFMTNSGRGVLSRFAPDGTLLQEWRNIGQVSFERPVGIFMDNERNQLYISDLARSQVHVFQVTPQPFKE